MREAWRYAVTSGPASSWIITKSGSSVERSNALISSSVVGACVSDAHAADIEPDPDTGERGLVDARALVELGTRKTLGSCISGVMWKRYTMCAVSVGPNMHSTQPFLHNSIRVQYST